MSARRLAAWGGMAAVALGASVAVGRVIVGSPGRPEPGAARGQARAMVPSGALLVARPSPRFVTVTDRSDGFAIDIPATWMRLRAADADVRLLANGRSEGSLLVRVTPVGLTVTPQTLDVVRGLTDSLVGADRRVRLLAEPRAITLGGLPGYRYVYAVGRARTAHVHYFLFMRKRLVALVFQVAGTRALRTSAPLLDRIADTFRVA